MDIGIRPYTDVDKVAVLSLIKLNTPLYFAESEAMDFAHYLDHEKEMYFVACIDGEVVGCGGINFEDNHNLAKISWDMVHPLYHGKNVGTKLLKYRLDIIQNQFSCQKVQVRTSQQAFRFYEKNGFSLTQVTKDYWAPGFDLYDMTLMK